MLQNIMKLNSLSREIRYKRDRIDRLSAIVKDADRTHPVARLALTEKVLGMIPELRQMYHLQEQLMKRVVADAGKVALSAVVVGGVLCYLL